VGIFSPAWQSKNASKRQAAVAGISDHAKLMEIFSKSEFGDIRLQVARQITDESCIKKLALEKADTYLYGNDIEIVSTLAGKVRDQFFFIELLKKLKGTSFSTSGEVESLMRRINDRVTEEAVIAEIVIAGVFYNNEESLRRLRNIDYFARIAREAYWADDKIFAIKRLADQSVLLSLAKDGGLESNVRIAAIERLEDKSALTDTIAQERDSDVKSCLMGFITDSHALLKLFEQASSQQEMESAIDAITDEEVLLQIAGSCDDIDLCLRAYEKLRNRSQAVASEVKLMVSSGKDARSSAIEKLIKLLSMNQNAAKAFWRFATKTAGDGHTDSSKPNHYDSPTFHYQGRPVYRDCAHSDNTPVHTDTGANIKIPPYPF